MVWFALVLRLAVAALIAAAFAASPAFAQQPDNWLTRLFQPASASAVPGAGDDAG